MKAQVVSFHCVVKNKLGQVLSSTFNHDVVTAHAEGDKHFLGGLVEGLQDLREGEKRRISVSAERAYGFYDLEKVIECSAECLRGRSAVVGESVNCMFKGRPTLFRLVAKKGDRITLDANHPLAGQDLVFEIEAVSAREARPDEIPGPEVVDTGLH